MRTDLEIFDATKKLALASNATDLSRGWWSTPPEGADCLCYEGILAEAQGVDAEKETGIVDLHESSSYLKLASWLYRELYAREYGDPKRGTFRVYSLTVRHGYAEKQAAYNLFLRALDELIAKEQEAWERAAEVPVP